MIRDITYQDHLNFLLNFPNHLSCNLITLEIIPTLIYKEKKEFFLRLYFFLERMKIKRKKNINEKEI